MNTENKIRNFLMNGFQTNENKSVEDEREIIVVPEVEIIEPAEEPVEKVVVIPEGDEEVEDEGEPVEVMEPEEMPQEVIYIESDPRIDEIQEQLVTIMEKLDAIQLSNKRAPDMTQYVTSKELLKRIKEVMNEKNAELSNQHLIRAMEQIAVMREDYTRLCMAMSEQLDSMSAEEVFSSFQTYGVDMENILIDGGVYIGAFPYEKLNTLHQRITGVVQTGEKEKDGTIAERETNGYKYGDRVLLKEKVKIYKYSEALDVPETVSTEEENEETTMEEEE